jgi:hypothetical protein
MLGLPSLRNAIGVRVFPALCPTSRIYTTTITVHNCAPLAAPTTRAPFSPVDAATSQSNRSVAEL